MSIVARGLGLSRTVVGALVAAGLTVKTLLFQPNTGNIACTLRPFVGAYSQEVYKASTSLRPMAPTTARYIQAADTYAPATFVTLQTYK